MRGIITGAAVLAAAATSPAQAGANDADVQSVLNQGRVAPFVAARDRVQEQLAAGEYDRVFDGRPVEEGSYPFMVALIFGETPDGMEYYGQFCGASLINDTHVLTAAHCVVFEDSTGNMVTALPEDIAIYVGSENFVGGERVEIAEIIVNPDYDPYALDGDIAVLRLASAATMGTPIDLPETASAQVQLASQARDVVTAIGWGQTELGDYPDHLLEVDLKLVESGVCNQNIVDYRALHIKDVLDYIAYRVNLPESVIDDMASTIRGYMDDAITDNMICAGVAGTIRDTCYGDSGGPLFVRNGDQFVQLGITSWGEGCGLGEDYGLFGVYTRVTAYSDWIAEVSGN